MRFLDSHGKDVIARKDGVWSGAELAARMSAALGAAKQTVPLWWKLAELDARATELPHAVFAMHCFWVGQARLGDLAGVADARPAFLEGLEVVDVCYDPAQISLTGLIEAADRGGVADRLWVGTDVELAVARKVIGDRATKLAAAARLAPESDDLRSLKASPWAQADLVRAQAVRFNAALAAHADAKPLVLSTRQLERGPKAAPKEVR